MPDLSGITFGARVTLDNGDDGLFLGWDVHERNLYVAYGTSRRGPVTMFVYPEQIRSYANVERYCEAVVLPLITLCNEVPNGKVQGYL